MKLLFFLSFFSIFMLPKAFSQSTASKQVTKFVIEAPQLDTLKTIWVYVPKEYSKTEKKYPVIYMHDAQNLFDDKTSYVGEWNVDEILDSLSLKHSIIVGIEHGNEKRIDELTPYKNQKYGGGKGELYLTFITNTLKPHIDVVYRTKQEAEDTTIFGSSLGGLLSFYAVIKYPETFGKAGVFSPAFWINPEIFTVVNESKIPETTKFYFLAGTDEGETMIPKLEEMLQLFESKKVNQSQYKSLIIKGGKHNEKLWRNNFKEAYLWLYE